MRTLYSKVTAIRRRDFEVVVGDVGSRRFRRASAFRSF